MKKYIVILLSLIFLNSCSDEVYDNINTSPIDPSQVEGDYLFSRATKSLFDQMVSTNVNRNVFRLFAQYWTETTYTDEANYDLNTRSITDNHWIVMYRNVLANLVEARRIISEKPYSSTFSPEMQKNQMAMCELLEIYTWQQLVDTFGNIPYSEALDVFIASPSYDDASDIYSDLLSRVDAAYNSLNESEGGFGSADLVYNGNVGAWMKFAASLKLKIGMRLADVNPSVASSAASSAVAQGVFTSNDDNFIFHYLSTNPNTNPLWTDLVESNRDDFVGANTIIDYMNELSDPRRPFYFRENLGEGVFEGGTYGATSNFLTNSQVGDLMYDPTFPGIIMDYSEIEFLLAEAVERGFSVGGTAESHYINAITASAEYWGVSSSDISTYLANPNVAYSSAPGNWREKIGKQFWISMYNRGFEGWSAWRKYDAPELNIPADSELPVPVRYTYPIDEQNLNQANYEQASSDIGGDTQQTKLFWDVN